MAIQIVITDDHPLILNGLRNLLHHAEDMEVTAAYQNGDQLLEGLRRQLPDVLLLDVQMPGLPGEAIARQVSELYPSVRILALTNQESIYTIRSMLQAGALGYVLKSASEEIIMQAVRTVYSGAEFLEPEVKDKIIRHTLHTRQEQGALHTIITKREKQVLQLVAANYSSQEIAAKLCISKRTVDNHRIGLLLKFGVKNSAGMVKKAIDQGIID